MNRGLNLLPCVMLLLVYIHLDVALAVVRQRRSLGRVLKLIILVDAWHISDVVNTLECEHAVDMPNTALELRHIPDDVQVLGVNLVNIQRPVLVGRHQRRVRRYVAEGSLHSLARSVVHVLGDAVLTEELPVGISGVHCTLVALGEDRTATHSARPIIVGLARSHVRDTVIHTNEIISRSIRCQDGNGGCRISLHLLPHHKHLR